MKLSMKYGLLFIFFILSGILDIQAQQREIISEITEDNYIFLLEYIRNTKEYLDSDLFLKSFHKSNRRFISQIQLNDRYYKGELLSGYSSIRMIKMSKNEYCFFLQIVPGLGGEYNEKRLKIVSFTDEKFKLLIDLNLDNATYKAQGNTILVSGTSFISFCERCDGPDLADPEDTFFIPLIISLQRQRVIIKCSLALDQKDQLIRKFSGRFSLAMERKTGNTKIYSAEYLAKRALHFMYYISINQDIANFNEPIILP